MVLDEAVKADALAEAEPRCLSPQLVLEWPSPDDVGGNVLESGEGLQEEPYALSLH
jgi:hypothetical protein